MVNKLKISMNDANNLINYPPPPPPLPHNYIS